MDGIAARELELETDRDMKLVDSPLLVAYEEETRSFPCRICGALYYSGAELELHIATYYADKGRYCVSTVKKNFEKIMTNSNMNTVLQLLTVCNNSKN